MTLRSDLRLAAPRPASSAPLCRRRHPVAGARHRRERGDFHAPGSAPASAARRHVARPARDGLPGRAEHGQQLRRADELVSDLPGSAEARRAVRGRLVPAARGGLRQHRPADRARAGRDRLRQLLHDAGREAGRRPRVQPGPGRSAPQRPSGRRLELPVLGGALREESRGGGAGHPRQRHADDDRRRVRGIVPRPRPVARAAAARADQDAAGDDARVEPAG